MKKIKFISLIITLSVLITLFFPLNQEKLFAQNLNPKISFLEDHHYDFGKVANGVELSHNFRFRNEGTSNLIIYFTGERGSSNLISATIIGNKTEYEPGETGEISVTCNTKEMKGKQELAIDVKSNDPDYKYYPLIIEFDVINY